MKPVILCSTVPHGCILQYSQEIEHAFDLTLKAHDIRYRAGFFFLSPSIFFAIKGGLSSILLQETSDLDFSKYWYKNMLLFCPVFAINENPTVLPVSPEFGLTTS